MAFRCCLVGTAASIAVLGFTALSLASPYQQHSLTPTAPSGRVDLHLKRWGMTAPLALPPAFGFRAGGAASQAVPKLPVLMQLESPAAAALMHGARVGRVVSTFVGLDELATFSARPDVRRIELRLPHHLHLDVNTVKNGAIAARNATGLSGRGVLIGLIDTGIDITHADFRNPDGSSRVVGLWDQIDDSFATSGGTIGSAPPATDSTGQPFGTLYTQDQINAALSGTGTVNSVDLVGHGTHVAGCAASNGRAPGGYTGIAPEADLIVVRAGGTAKRDFVFSGDTVAALQWIDQQATDRRQPLVVNMSFGQHFGPHDDTSLEEVVVDDFVSIPGRVVAVSAGNERDAAIHTAGSARGGKTLQVEVGSSTTDLMAIDCWIPGGDAVDLAFTDPTGEGIARGNVPLGQCSVLQGATQVVSLCVDVVDSANQGRDVFMIVEPLATDGRISAGRWSMTLLDDGRVTDGHYDCWSVNDQAFVHDGDGSLTVAMPGTARGAITAGAASLRVSWPSQAGPDTQIGTQVEDDLAVFSSSGPTRDGRIKPDLTTGGEWVLSAWSVADGTGSGLAGDPIDPKRVSADGSHVASRGTSFSAPQVAGTIALMLQADPTLSAAAIADVLRSTARTDGFTGTTPNQLWGYGKLDVAAAAAMIAPAACVADCNHDGAVSVDELVMAVRIALGDAAVLACPAADHDNSSHVTVDELEGAVVAALLGCR